ncbi:alpha/beta hydrolase [Pontibacter cellulosilyticus]|uniref:Phospholipase n=1 Tax=Pontibacter cellulosilyticus TaxID=1720253 RepID=A0A923SIS5_9BACT|nr:phospholipase [Pontibacter cellulosilyticus]MBC5991976.1 phospholipase [Pontibacter cellulosilyticus]
MVTERDKYKTGRLTARTEALSLKEDKPAGVYALGLAKEKDTLLYIPEKYTPTQPAALAVMLHGAGAPAEQGLSLLRRYADELNIILVAPASRSYSWDIIADHSFGPDVISLDGALAEVFSQYAINKEQLAIGGFSDGASYALSMGLTNGDLFTHIIAFSPGFAYTLERHGKPAVFISHGVEDPVLPIDPCGRRIVPQLQQQGLEVKFTEFDGGHEIPAAISEDAVNWFLDGRAQA